MSYFAKSNSQPSDESSIGTLSLVEYPHPALFRKAKPLLRIDEGVRDAVEQMFEIMYDAQGVGWQRIK